MEIKLNPKIDPVAPSQGPPHKTHGVRVEKDGAAFEHTEALNRAMKVTAETRAEKVDLGKELAANIKYPPPEIINRIANLLALNVESDGEQPKL